MQSSIIRGCWVLAGCLMMSSGCAVIMAVDQPPRRPPENLVEGLQRDEVVDIYGHPIAVGMNMDGTEYIEQMQFVDGIGDGWRITRIVSHVVLDGCTWFLWEIVGGALEWIGSDHPEYVYYLIYDDNDKLVRAVNGDSEEGRKLATLPWASPRLPTVTANRPRTVQRLRVEDRKKTVGGRENITRKPNASNLVDATQNKEINQEKGKMERQNGSLYRILSCERESGSDFAYRFELELTGKDKSLKSFRSVQREFREAVKEDYTESFPGVRQCDLHVDFTEYKLNDGKIEGRAVVLTISVVSMKYDSARCTGMLSICVNSNQYEEGRKWARKNIETLVRDKNIALTTGEIPPAAKFYLGREELKDGNILEIEFKTE